MPYGKGQSIGEGVNAALGIYDYQPWVRSEQMKGAALANAVTQVAGTAMDLTEERKKNKQAVTSSKQTAKAIAQLIPELSPVLSEQIAMMDDEELPLSERAGVANAITDILNLGTAEIKSRALMGMEAKRLQLSEMDTISSINARNADTSAAIDRTLALGEIGSFNLGSAINYAKDNPRYSKATGISAKDLEDAKNLSAPAQAAVAESYFARLPKEEQAKYINDFPVNVGGTNAKLPGVVQGNRFFPTQISGMDDPLAPPDGIMPDGSPIDATGVSVDGSPGVLPPRITVGNIDAPAPISPKDAQAMEIAAQDQVMKIEAAENEQAQAAAAKNRVLSTIDKYMTPDGKPTSALSDAVGYGEGVASWMRGVTGIPLNQADTVANQKQLKLDLIEQSLLEASKALKPVSNDEMKMLKANRPELTDPPEVWTQYMKRVKEIIGNPENYQQDPVQSRVSDTSALRAKLGK
jgi:hypothetical protein